MGTVHPADVDSGARAGGSPPPSATSAASSIGSSSKAPASRSSAGTSRGAPIGSGASAPSARARVGSGSTAAARTSPRGVGRGRPGISERQRVRIPSHGRGGIAARGAGVPGGGVRIPRLAAWIERHGVRVPRLGVRIARERARIPLLRARIPGLPVRVHRRCRRIPRGGVPWKRVRIPPLRARGARIPPCVCVPSSRLLRAGIAGWLCGGGIALPAEGGGIEQRVGVGVREQGRFRRCERRRIVERGRRGGREERLRLGLRGELGRRRRAVPEARGQERLAQPRRGRVHVEAPARRASARLAADEVAQLGEAALLLGGESLREPLRVQGSELLHHAAGIGHRAFRG